MESLRQWAVALCVTAVVGTLLRFCFPDTTVGRQGKLLLSCLFLCVLLTPLSTWKLGVKISDFTVDEPIDSAGLEAQMQAQLERQVSESLTAMVNQSLATYGWSAKKVTAKMDIREDGSIDMGQIVVYVDEDTAVRSVAVRQVAEKRLGTVVTVAVWEE